MAASATGRPASVMQRPDLPVVVALGNVGPALVAGILDGHCRFVAAPDDADLAAAAGAIVRADVRVDQALLGRAPRLQVLARTGVGTDLVDVPAATARGIAVVVTPGAGAAAVAEGAIGMALHLVKRFGPLTALVREGRWAERGGTVVGDLGGATLGVIGYGRIGRRTDQTRHLAGEDFLARVKLGAILVNCGRGGLIDADAVWRALTSGRLSGVGLDVLAGREPQAAADPAWRTSRAKEIHAS